jgi:hypothetical protein
MIELIRNYGLDFTLNHLKYIFLILEYVVLYHTGTPNTE